MTTHAPPAPLSPAGQLGEKLSDVKRQLSESLRNDPRKAWLVTILLAVMLVLWGRMLLGGRGPADAMAAHPPAPAAVVSAGRSTRREPPLALAEWARRPVKGLDRNLFSVPFDYYPQDGTRAPQPTRSSEDAGFWDEVAKSMSARADQKKERQILVENLQTQAASLSVQGTILGARPKAWVNGALVGVGDEVESSGFRVVKIESRRIVVEREGVRLEIPMK